MNHQQQVSPAGQLAEVMTRIYDLHLTTPSGGNISVMDDEGIAWVTPSQVDKGKLLPEDMVRIFPDGTIEGRHSPTMEYRFHMEIYRSRPDIRAIVHAHPPALVAFSLVSHSVTFDDIPSLIRFDRPIGYSKYAIPGSALLGDHIRDGFSGGSHAVFMENHGIITTGKTLQEAFHRMENLETAARIFVNALQVGRITKLAEDDLEAARKSFPAGYDESAGHKITAEEMKIRGNLAETVKRAYKRKLFTADSGCFSARTEDGFLVTREGEDVAGIKPEELVFVSHESVEEGKIPLQFSHLHREIYRKHHFVHSICSAHPVSVMAFAVTGTPLETHTIPESFLMLNEVPRVPFRQRFTDPAGVAGMITPAIPALLLMNDCITVTGNSPFQVFDRLEVAEFTAKSILYAKPVGPVRPISEGDIDDLARTFA